MSDSRSTILVTGATDGIGRETALQLARRGARVIAHGRDERRLRETHAALTAAGPVEPGATLRADLGALEEVRGLVAELERRGERPTVLLNNAGVYQRAPSHTVDGFETTFGVNHLAPFLLTHLLLASPAGAALERVVNVSSVAHQRGRIELDDLDFRRRGFDAYGAYAASKLANVLFTIELSRRLRGRPPTVNALHPGVVSTKLLRHGFGMEGPDTLARGAATSVKLALDPALARTTGAYFTNGERAAVGLAARDPDLARRLYDVSAERTGVAPLPA